MELPTTVGVEVEFAEGDTRAIIRALRQAHLFGWQIKQDASCGHELVTPILSRTEDGESLARALQILKDNGAQVNHKCGLHVHVGVQSYSFDNVTDAIRFYLNHEDVVFDLVDSARHDNTFCRRLSPETRAEAMRVGSDAWSVDESHLPTTRREARRTWINGQAHQKYNTLEIRLMEGTLDFDKIWGWTCLHAAMVHAAATSRHRLKVSPTLTSLLVSIGCYRLRGRDPELHQLVARSWAVARQRELAAARARRATVARAETVVDGVRYAHSHAFSPTELAQRRVAQDPSTLTAEVLQQAVADLQRRNELSALAAMTTVTPVADVNVNSNIGWVSTNPSVAAVSALTDYARTFMLTYRFNTVVDGTPSTFYVTDENGISGLDVQEVSSPADVSNDAADALAGALAVMGGV